MATNNPLYKMPYSFSVFRAIKINYKQMVVYL